jgi:hemin uptake protein HemP
LTLKRFTKNHPATVMPVKPPLSAPLKSLSPACPPAASHGAGADHDSGAALSSAELLQGRKTIAIAHNGATYHLQATRLGKLILTK